MITNFFYQANSSVSKRTSSFFRKDKFKEFLLLSSKDNYYSNLKITQNKAALKKANVLSRNKEFDKADKSKTSYLYKPENYLNNNSFYECFFMRKTKNFNKGRYSRNRQVYRTGVYMCFYINVIALYLLWFYFYKFKFKFTYLWWVFILLPFSFINARALKYNLYLPSDFVFHLRNYVNWFLFFFRK